jgi:hypothetical protein
VLCHRLESCEHRAADCRTESAAKVPQETVVDVNGAHRALLHVSYRFLVLTIQHLNYLSIDIENKAFVTNKTLMTYIGCMNYFDDVANSIISSDIMSWHFYNVQIFMVFHAYDKFIKLSIHNPPLHPPRFHFNLDMVAHFEGCCNVAFV